MADLPDLVKRLYPNDHRKVMEALAYCWRDGKTDNGKDEEWQREMQMYVTYADSFRTGGKSGFDALSDQLPRIQNLGCNAVHVLPFLLSPLVDAGFDISDSYLVREDLGGNQALDRFLDRAKKLKMTVLMDMVFNHVSEEHRWFRQAVSGDLFYRNFFVHSEERPRFIKKFADERAVWGRYEIGEREVDIRVIFPEQAGEIPHWREGPDGYWYYHTFYPQQLDLDWNNYNVFVAYAKVMVYWLKKGLSFRLDAIPFVGKNILKGEIESSDRTHWVVQALNQVRRRVSRRAVFLLEVNQPVYVMRKYFGEEAAGGSKEGWWRKPSLKKRDDVIEAELLYNFPLMNSMWAALVTGKSENMWTCLLEEEKLPNWASWVSFLRNHDELTLEFTDEKLRKLILNNLLRKGLKFREGFGVAGRTASFLKFDERRIVMAHFLMASMPGSPAIIFGDEIGKGNDFEFMKEMTKEKKKRVEGIKVADDARDINRGWIGDGELAEERGQLIEKELGKILKTRQKFIGLAKELPKRVKVKEESVFAADYDLGEKKLRVVVNLSGEEVRVGFKNLGKVVVAVNDGVVKGNEVVLPGYGGVWVEMRDGKAEKLEA